MTNLKYKKLDNAVQKSIAFRVKMGDNKDFTSLVSSMWGRIHAVAISYKGWGLAKEELLQMGTMGVHLACKSYDEEKCPYFYTHASNQIRGAMKDLVDKTYPHSKRGASMVDINSEEGFAIQSEEPNGEDIAEHNSEIASVNKIIDDMIADGSVRPETVRVWRDYENGYSLGEIVDAHNTDPNNKKWTKQRVSLIRRQFVEKLSKRLIESRSPKTWVDPNPIEEDDDYDDASI